MESYHGHMKDWLFIRHRNHHEKRMNEFLHLLVATVAIMYWYKYLKKAVGLVKNKKKNKFFCNVIFTARDIDHSQVTWPEGYIGPPKVPSLSKPGLVYLVKWRLDQNPCQCFWSLQGSYCKHQVIVKL
jgi:hypothetical protein